jgi:xanthine/uracil permease
MFEGEKTFVFWIGLIILGLASVGLFTVVWNYTIYKYNSDYYLRSSFPLIVGGIVFILIGFYMMKSGVKKNLD